MHPAQQHGRRFPAARSSFNLFKWLSRVSNFLLEITQHIHSLRASGVMSSHVSRAFGVEARTFFRSSGTLCTRPFDIFIHFYNNKYIDIIHT